MFFCMALGWVSKCYNTSPTPSDRLQTISLNSSTTTKRLPFLACRAATSTCLLNRARSRVFPYASETRQRARDFLSPTVFVSFSRQTFRRLSRNEIPANHLKASRAKSLRGLCNEPSRSCSARFLFTPIS